MKKHKPHFKKKERKSLYKTVKNLLGILYSQGNEIAFLREKVKELQGRADKTDEALDRES